MIRAAVLFAATLASATPSQAQDNEIPPAYASRPSEGELPALGPFFAEFGTSVGGPAGWFNGSIGVLPAEWLDVRIGLGIGTSGIQAALGTAAHVPLGDRAGVGVDVGASVGPYEYETGFFNFDLEYREVYEWAVAFWGNAAASIYVRIARVFRLRIYAGYGRVLNPGAARCVDSDGRSCTEAPSTGDSGILSDLDIRFFGAGFAYTFGG